MRRTGAKAFRARTAWLGALCGLGTLIAPAPVGAQSVDLNLLALDWLRGRYASPLVCEGAGRAERAIRRVVVARGPRHARPPVDRMTFHGIDVEGAERCIDVLGREQPEVRGTVQLTLPGASHPDTATADFQRSLRFRGGFDFQVTEGRLQLRGWDPEVEPRVVDFAGGTARIRRVTPGSDADRILRDLEGPLKLTLELSAPAGDVVFYHLVLYDVR